MDNEDWKETDIPTCEDVRKYVNLESHLIVEAGWRGQPTEAMFTEYRKGGELIRVEQLGSRYHRDALWMHRKDIKVLDILPTSGVPEPPERGRLCPRDK